MPNQPTANASHCTNVSAGSPAARASTATNAFMP
jgi:hypothetical protein